MIKVRNEINVIYKKVLDAYFATKTEEIEYEIVKGKESNYKAISGDNLSKIASKNKITLAKLKEDNGLKSNDIKVGQAFIIKQNDKKTEKGKKLTFTKLNKAILGQEVYIIVKTENLDEIEIQINVKQAKEKVLVEKDKAITVLQDDSELRLIKTKVGDYSTNDKITNKDEFKHWAIAKIILAPKKDETLKSYIKALNTTTDKKTHLFLAVDASTEKGNDAIFCNEKGEEIKSKTPNFYLNETEKWLEFINEDPIWMLTAKNELGEKEISGKEANKQILEYFKASKFWGTDDSGGENAWCGSFVSWVMKKHKHSPPSNAFRAKEWKNFGKVITSPVYGAIGVKSRKGGGHVAFIVGKSKDDEYYFMLGGNQSDEVNITKYKKTVWDTFVVPKDYDITDKTLPIYSEQSKKAGSES